MSDEIDRNAFQDFERDAHDRLADTYHAFFASVTEHAADPLLAAANVHARMSVLDVACGSGVVAKHAARRGAFVTGVDLSPRMLHLASRLNPGCTFREASVDSMPFDDGVIRHADEHRTTDGLELPMAFKVCAGRKTAVTTA